MTTVRALSKEFEQLYVSHHKQAGPSESDDASEENETEIMLLRAEELLAGAPESPSEKISKSAARIFKEIYRENIKVPESLIEGIGYWARRHNEAIREIVKKSNASSHIRTQLDEVSNVYIKQLENIEGIEQLIPLKEITIKEYFPNLFIELSLLTYYIQKAHSEKRALQEFLEENAPDLHLYRECIYYINLSDIADSIKDEDIDALSQIFPNVKRLVLRKCLQLTDNIVIILQKFKKLAFVDVRYCSLLRKVDWNFHFNPNKIEIIRDVFIPTPPKTTYANEWKKAIEQVGHVLSTRNVKQYDASAECFTELGELIGGGGARKITELNMTPGPDRKRPNDEAVVALTKILDRRECNINVLNLSRNYIGDKGIRSLAEIIAKKGFEVLRLERNNISSEGCAALAKAIHKSSLNCLKILNLNENPIGDSGLKEILDVLTQSSIQTLFVGSCKITKVSIEKINDFVLKACNLKQISLWGNFFGQEVSKLKNAKIRT